MHPAFLLSLPLLVRPVRLAEMSQVLVAALALKKTKKQKAVQWCNLVVHKVKRQRTLSFLLLNSSAGHLQAIDVSLHSSLQNWQLFFDCSKWVSRMCFSCWPAVQNTWKKIHKVTVRGIPYFVCGGQQGCQRRTYLHLILVIPAPFYCCHCRFTTQTRPAALPGLCQQADMWTAQPAYHPFFFFFALCRISTMAW